MIGQVEFKGPQSPCSAVKFKPREIKPGYSLIINLTSESVFTYVQEHLSRMAKQNLVQNLER